MAWGKIIGGVIGAAMGGPLGAGIGVLVGSGWERSDDESANGLESEENALSKAVVSISNTDNVMHFRLMLPREADVDHILVQMRQAGSMVRAVVPHFGDDDGSFAIVKPVVDQGVSIDIPLHATEFDLDEPQDFELLVAAIRDREGVGFLTRRLEMHGEPQPWSDVAWLDPIVDLLAHYALRHGPWTGEKVRVIKAAIGQFVELDNDEMRALRDRLKLEQRPPIPECIATYGRRFDLDELAIALLRGIWNLMELAEQSEAVILRELNSLGERMDLSPEIAGAVLNRHEQEPTDADAQSTDKDVQWACEVLGVEPSASKESVQQAWRRKVSELHPDRYANLPGSVRKLIEDKAQEVNRARDILQSR